MPTVTFVLSLHGGLAWGGLESQAMHTKATLERRGWNVNVLAPQDRELGEIVHFFGTFEGYWDVARQVQERRIPYVCSPVFSPPCTGSALRFRAVRKAATDRTIFRGQKKLYEKSARLIVLTQAERQNLEDFYGHSLAKSTQIPNGLTRVMPDSPTERNGVLCVGRLDDGKNQLTLIQAMKGVSSDLTLIGATTDASYASKCRTAAESNVHFQGAVSPDDPALGEALVGTKVFALVSRMEVLSLAAIEAACAGARLVLSNTWGAEEYFGDDAIYVSPTDMSAIRLAIQSQLSTTESREAIEARRKKYAALFHWDRVAEDVETVYREVLSSR